MNKQKSMINKFSVSFTELVFALFTAFTVIACLLILTSTPNNFIVGVLGFVASVISFVLWLPQSIQVWKQRKAPAALKSISVETQLLVFTNATVWAAYGVLTKAFWVSAPGLVNGPLALFIIFLVFKSRRDSEGSSSCK